MRKTLPTPEPTYSLVDLFPYQGQWTEDDYLSLTSSANRLVEFSEGRLDVLGMPSERHQRIVALLFFLLYAFVKERKLGIALTAPLRVKLWEGKIREPDIVFMHEKHIARRSEQLWQGADLVMEIVSPDDPKRDTHDKFEEYAKAQIPEYWLVDPRDEAITIFVLEDSAYHVHAKGQAGNICSSSLRGFCVDVTEVFGA